MILLKPRIFNTNFTILNKHQIVKYTIQIQVQNLLSKIKAPNILGIYNTLGAWYLKFFDLGLDNIGWVYDQNARWLIWINLFVKLIP